MKKIISTLLLLCTIQSIGFSQSKNKDIQSDSMNVKGNCNMCKSRIEDAAYIKGVKEAVWDIQTHTLHVIYKSSKTDLAKIKKSVLKAGHDVDSTIAIEAAYQKLPDCCQYRSQTCNH